MMEHYVYSSHNMYLVLNHLSILLVGPVKLDSRNSKSSSEKIYFTKAFSHERELTSKWPWQEHIRMGDLSKSV